MADFLKKEWLFVLFLTLFFPLFYITQPTLKEIVNSVDFPTIRALTALLLITTAIKLSNFFDMVAVKTVNKFKTERNLAISFIILAVFLSMFITNDITLFIIVPLTLSFNTQLKNDLTKIIIFEAIAVNVGSELTPFGNPQNLFLFRQMDLSVIEFIEKMAPLMLIKFTLLLVFAIFSFKPDKLQIYLTNSP